MTQYWRNVIRPTSSVNLSVDPAMILEDWLGVSHYLTLGGDVEMSLSSHASVQQKFTRPVDFNEADSLTVSQDFSGQAVDEDETLYPTQAVGLTVENQFSSEIEVSDSIQFLGDVPWSLETTVTIVDTFMRL